MTKVSNVQKGGDAAAPASMPAPEAKGAVPNGIHYVTDSRGRRIGLKKPNPVERFELDDAIETKTQAAGLQVSIVGCMVSIDDEGYPPLWNYDKPRTEFKKRLMDLGDEGLSAITPPALKMFGIDIEAFAEGEGEAKLVRNVKNS